MDRLYEAKQYLNDNPSQAAALLCVAVILIGILLVAWLGRTIRGDSEEMADRQVALDYKYAEGIHEMLFDMLIRGEISRQEYRRDLQRFGLKFKMADIIRARHHPAYRKWKVKQNHRTVVEPVRAGVIPGPKPGEALPTPPVVLVVAQRRAYVAVAKPKRREEP